MSGVVLDAGNLSWCGNATWKGLGPEDRCLCAPTWDTASNSILPYWRMTACDIAIGNTGTEIFLACALAFAWMMFMFSVIASTADEWLVPNLERLSDSLRLSPNVAGVTILAFGNGAPEFFTLLAAFRGHHGDVAVGSLLGGGMFITTVVLGSVSIIAPFNPYRRPLLRDVGFYFAAIIVLGIVISDQKVTFNESMYMVVLYIVYICTVIFGRIINQKWPTLTQRVLRKRLTIGGGGRLGLGGSLLPPLEEPSNTRTLDQSLDEAIGSQQDLDVTVVSSANGSTGGGGTGRVSPSSGRINCEPTASSEAATPTTPATPRKSVTIMLPPPTLKQRAEKLYDWVGEAANWEEKGTFARVMFPFELLFILARDLSIPLLEEENWKRRTCALSVIGAAQYLLFVISGGDSWGQGGATIPYAAGMPLSLLLLVCSIPFSGIVYWCTADASPPGGLLGVLLLFLGFGSAVLWTNSIATELVACLTLLGGVIGVSNGVLGLTVLAWGNSIGDFIADTSLARGGNPRMGAVTRRPLDLVLVGGSARCAYERGHSFGRPPLSARPSSTCASASAPPSRSPPRRPSPSSYTPTSSRRSGSRWCAAATSVVGDLD